MKQPKLISNTKPDITACLGALYTWDRILQTGLEGQKEVNRAWWQPPLSFDSWKPVQSWCMLSGTRSNKEKDLLFSDDLAHLECTIRRGQNSTVLDATTSSSIDTHNQPSTDTRPSLSIDPNRSTTIDTTPRQSSAYCNRSENRRSGDCNP
ncbi:hypothetical protein F2Q68_00033474 [Brassica cretica]|uniref:Uncharacterized protein n=1 Tax=Brassica cretica TaxID=69181 RepID=A0A8S9H994_BRACR|nr:hypothetical protein F2Q68_00033474 [Brassica cretica]